MMIKKILLKLGSNVFNDQHEVGAVKLVGITEKEYERLINLKPFDKELGIDLVTLLYGLFNKRIVWVKLPYTLTEDGPLPEILAFDLAEEKKWSFKEPCYFKLDIADVQCVFYLKDYGKTWAFDREVLL